MGNTQEVHDAVAGLLARNQTVTLSTSAGDRPWGAGAFFAELDDPFTLGIVLETNGTTLRNLRQNPQLAVVIANGDPFAPFLQGHATATVLDEAGKDKAISALRAKAPQIEPMLGAPIEAVELRVGMWRVTDIPSGWLPGKELRP